MKKTLIEKGTILTLDGHGTVHDNGYIYLENGMISAVGAGPAPGQLREKAEEIIDAEHKAVMPGMVNAHTHLFQTFIRGLADDRPLLDWLKTAIWPVAESLRPEEIYLAAKLGFLENIRSGATAVIDHQYIHTDPENDDAVLQAAEDTGVRLLLARGWTDMDYHPAFMEEPDFIVREVERLHGKWHGAGDGRLKVEFAPLIPWGCSNETMQRTHEISRQLGVGTHIHVAETQEEIDISMNRRGIRHIEWLDNLGVLDSDVQLVHSVWLDEHELDLVAKSEATVVHCPVSNMYLASGVAPVRKMLDRGITVALATDGPGSNNNQDMMEVLKTTALLQKVDSLDAMALLPQDVLGMACNGGAVAFGEADELGSLETGKKADVTVVDLDSPLCMPVHKADSAVVYNASCGNVDTVLVGGRFVLRNKQVVGVDEKELLEEARESCRGLFKRNNIEY